MKINKAVERDPENEAEHAAGREVAVGERAQVDDRVFRHERAPEEPDARDRGDEAADEDRVVGESYNFV